MIACASLKGKKIAVLGLGKSGRAAVESLQASGVEVIAWDDNEKARTKDLPIENLHDYDLSTLDILVLSPGIPHTLPSPHPIAERAKQANVEIMNDVQLFVKGYAHDIIAVTGTNGKSTTTALVHHVLSAHKKAQLGGNIGTPIMSLDPSIKTTVAELSSYQTEITNDLSALAVVWLNITPDHLERHGDMEGYVQAKKKIFETKRQDGVAIVSIDDSYSLQIYKSIKESNDWLGVPISTKQKLYDGISILDGEIYDHGVYVGSMETVTRLKGEHNHQNAASAYAVARVVYKMHVNDILAQFETFAGLAHRQYHIATIAQTDYINDSKATNAEATQKALQSYKNIYWLAGGVEKDGGITSLRPHLRHVTKSYLYGECASSFAQTLAQDNHPYEVFANMEDAFTQAHKDAQLDKQGATVLLSPASASFDQYPNFEKRGEHFQELVQTLTK